MNKWVVYPMLAGWVLGAYLNHANADPVDRAQYPDALQECQARVKLMEQTAEFLNEELGHYASNCTCTTDPAGHPIDDPCKPRFVNVCP